MVRWLMLGIFFQCSMGNSIPVPLCCKFQILSPVNFVCSRMIDWLSWPLAQHIDTWVIALLKGLAAVQKFTILIDVTLLKIELVCIYFQAYIYRFIYASFTMAKLTTQILRINDIYY